MNMYEVLRRPLVTEKSTALKADSNKVVFQVAIDANKKEIKQAIEKIFDVKVMGVNTAITRGKMKRVGRQVGFRKNWKKAMVTLEAGTDMDVFGITSFESGAGAEESE